MSRDIELPYNWVPRPYQRPVWKYLREGGRRAVICWPRRHGKDDVGMQWTAVAMGKRKGVYWYLLPKYAQARKAVWDAIDEEKGVRRIDLIFPKAIRDEYSEQEMMVGYDGSYMQVVGADTFHSLVGSPPVGVVFSEYARTDPSAWGYIMPILEKNQGWAIFNSTPYGDNHFKTFCDMAERRMREGRGWFHEKLTAPDCGVYTGPQLTDIEEQLVEVYGPDYGRSLFQQEYHCSFDASIPGAYFAEHLDRAQHEGRIQPFAIDPAVPVYTAWDLGRTDDTAIWWYQLIQGDIMVFDFHSSSLKDMDFYMDLLEQKRDQYRCRYSLHWLPHDARPRTQAAGAGSILQQCTEHARRKPALGRFAIAKRLDKQEQIQAVRKTLPRCRFHDTRCAEGLRALRHYHREWDETVQKFNDTPVHDWCVAAGTMVLTPTGWTPVERLSVQHQVVTPRGTRGILRAGLVRRTTEWTTINGIHCTPEHRFFTNHGLKEARAIESSQDRLWTRDRWGLRFLACWCALLRVGFRDGMTMATPRGHAAHARPASSFIGWSIRLGLVRVRHALRAIIEMGARGRPLLTPWHRSLVASPARNTNPRREVTGSAGTADRNSVATRHAERRALGPARALGTPETTWATVRSEPCATPAYNITVDRDQCYFVRGHDGKAYLVSNSSHPSDAMMILALTWQEAAPPPPSTPAWTPITAFGTWGERVKKHFTTKQRERERWL